MKKALLLLSFVLSYSFGFSQCNDLFISEYIEGSSFNKVIEIYNPTTSNVPLSGLYAIRVYSNGSATPSATINLTGTINANSTYILCHTSADPSVLAIADQTSGSLSHNGDDAIELFRTFTSTSIDVIGEIGIDPGAEWLLNGVSGTVNHTLVRKPNIQQGNLTWTGGSEMEWDIYAQDDFTYLASHIMNPCGPQPLAADFTYSDVCLGTANLFMGTATGGDGNYSYAWDFGDGVGTSTLQNPTYTYSVPGSYTVQFVVVDGTFNTALASYTVNVFDPPSANSTPDVTSGCAPLTVCYNTNVTGGVTPYNYLWSTGNTVANPCEIYNETDTTILIVTDMNGCTDTVINIITVLPQDDASFYYDTTVYCFNDPNPVPTITGTAGGTFSCSCTINPSTGEIDFGTITPGTYSVTYTTSGTCFASSVFSITVNNQLDATITPAGPFCEIGVPINLNAADGGGTWSGNGIIDANLGTFDPAAAGVGMHTITYTISGNCGDIQTTQIEVLANQTVNIYNPDTAICNDIFGFFLNADPGGTWSGNNVTDNGSGNGFFSSAAISAGVYYAVYTIPGQCGDQDSISIAVSGTPTAGFTFTTNLGTADFTDASTGAISYLWDFDGLGTSTLQSPSFIFPMNGSYNVCLTVTNSSGCSNTSCQMVTITGLGINENKSTVARVYPNPSDGNFTIENKAVIKNITICDMIGKNVYSANINCKSTIIHLSGLNSGFYFVEIITDSGKEIKRIEIMK